MKEIWSLSNKGHHMRPHTLPTLLQSSLDIFFILSLSLSPPPSLSELRSLVRRRY